MIPVKNLGVAQGPAGLAVKPLDLHLVNVGSIPTGPTHGEGRLQPHPGDVLKIHPECPEEPQIRVECGGEAERSPNLHSMIMIEQLVSAFFDVGRDDGLRIRRNLLGVTLYEDL